MQSFAGCADCGFDAASSVAAGDDALMMMVMTPSSLAASVVFSLWLRSLSKLNNIGKRTLSCDLLGN